MKYKIRKGFNGIYQFCKENNNGIENECADGYHRDGRKYNFYKLKNRVITAAQVGDEIEFGEGLTNDEINTLKEIFEKYRMKLKDNR